MSTLAFVIWMIGWPLGWQIALAYSKKCNLEYSEEVRDIASLFQFVTWIVIGILLWKNR
jgi:hypothetical protein